MRPETATRFALLGLLLDRPSHGYDLYQRFTDPAGLGQVWHLGMSQMYADLKTLEERGWVGSRTQQQDTRPAKRIFTLTPAGRTAFLEWMARPSRGLREMRVEFIARLYFAGRTTDSDVGTLISREEKTLRQELIELRRAMPPPLDSNAFVRVVHSFRISQIEAALAWLKSARKFAARNRRRRSSSKGRLPNTLFKEERK